MYLIKRVFSGKIASMKYILNAIRDYKQMGSKLCPHL